MLAYHTGSSFDYPGPDTYHMQLLSFIFRHVFAISCFGRFSEISTYLRLLSLMQRALPIIRFINL